MKIGSKNQTVIPYSPPPGRTPSGQSPTPPDSVQLTHPKSAGRRAFESTPNGLRTIILGSGGAALNGAGGWQSAGGYFLGTMGGVLAGYCAGEGLHDAIKAHHAAKGEEAPKWIEHAPEVGAAVGAGVGLLLTHFANPLLSGGILGVAAVVGGYHIDGYQPGDVSAWRRQAHSQQQGI